MPFITNPLTGQVYDIPGPALHRDLLQLHRIRGDEWLHTELNNQHNRGRAHPVDGPIEDYVPSMAAPVVKKRIRRDETPPETLELPVVPETDEEGNKRLYKTRYAILEKKYADLHSRHQRTLRHLNESNDYGDQQAAEVRKLQNEVLQLRNMSVDSEAILKRMNQIAAEIKLEMPHQPDFVPLSQKLETFLGAIFCRIRTIEEEQDELAD